MDDLFAPPEETWHPISAHWKSLERLTLALGVGIVFSVAALIVGFASALWWISGLIWLAAVIIILARWALIGRSWRSWGYALRPDDLYIRHGWMFRTLRAVPYGRMQAVDVTSGPLERAFGLATVQLITASPESDAQINGLPPEEAKRLRDQLTQAGESQASGL